MSSRRHLHLVPDAPRQMVLSYGSLDAEARGADVEPVRITANELIAAQLEAIAQGLRAAAPERRAG